MEYSSNSFFSNQGSTVYSSNHSTHSYVNNNNNHKYQQTEHISKAAIKKSQVNKFFALLQVIFVISLIIFLYTITLSYHLIPLSTLSLQIYENQFIYECTIYHTFFILFTINYLLCLFISPGYIPDEPQWYVDQSSPDFKLLEKKRTGAPRQCGWCNKYKPDRTHHCSRCNACVLKMDHHCPWTAKCVGWNNYKFFFLTIFYATLTLFYTAYIITPTTVNMLRDNTVPFQTLSLVFLVNIFALIMALPMLLFLNFHLWLILKNKTTVEYLEKFKRMPNWDLGYYRNICSALGSNPLFWLLPIPNHETLYANGLYFSTKSKEYDKSNAIFDDLDFNDNITDIMNSNETVGYIHTDFIKTARNSEIFEPILDGHFVQ